MRKRRQNQKADTWPWDFGGVCSYKMKGRHLGLWMGLVKLVNIHASKSKTNKKSLQNRLQKNLDRINLDV